ncbi:MAG: ATP-dependent helicase [Candidatus Nanopelagicales bacterium]|nr:ATP-dependent helicase [Candidatus Nanopelagicales bacterium]
MDTRRIDAALADLDPEQRAVATSLDGPVLVIAGAGTGKTTAITHRVAHAVAAGRQDPAETVALTFTTRAAGNMSRRLADLGVANVRVRTFHSAALRQLRWAWPAAVGGQMPELMATKFGLLRAVVTKEGIPADAALIRDLASEIEWGKAVQVGPDGYPDQVAAVGRQPPAKLEAELVARIYRSYEQAKRDAGRLDFEDVLLLTVAILEERADLRDRVQQSFRHLTVDEYQDVSAIQQRLLDLWLGDSDDICVVGDPNQTIYSFAGAEAAHLRQFPGRYPGARVLKLVRCYRCSPEIVTVATRALIGGNQPKVRKDPAVGARLISQCESGPDPRFVVFDSEVAEARWAAREISRLIESGVEAKEIAILVRINSATGAFESALGSARIPYAVRGGRRFFERPEIKRAVVLLRASARTKSDERPGVAVRNVLLADGWRPDPPAGVGASRETWESLAALVALADELEARDGNSRLADYCAEVERRAADQDAPAGVGVTLASLHAAKGLEWSAVFLPNLVDGMIPLSYAADEASIEEERRLLYVGMTRARRQLYLSWAHSRVPGGRRRSPSRFLADELSKANEIRA